MGSDHGVSASIDRSGCCFPARELAQPCDAESLPQQGCITERCAAFVGEYVGLNQVIPGCLGLPLARWIPCALASSIELFSDFENVALDALPRNLHFWMARFFVAKSFLGGVW